MPAHRPEKGANLHPSAEKAERVDAVVADILQVCGGRTEAVENLNYTARWSNLFLFGTGCSMLGGSRVCSDDECGKLPLASISGKDRKTSEKLKRGRAPKTLAAQRVRRT
jgi:hypothetical protein